MAARLYSNENFHRLEVEALRELGHDVLTSLEAGRSNRRIPDDEVLQFATSEGRAVLTFNRLHFIRLHRSIDGRHEGVVVCSEDMTCARSRSGSTGPFRRPGCCRASFCA